MMKIMRRLLPLFICLAIFAVVLTWFIVSIETTPCVATPPQHFDPIASSAKWIGGCDGGFWFDVLDIDTINSKYTISIHNDYNGNLIAIDQYVKSNDCSRNYTTKEQLYSDIIDFDFESILLGSCRLIPINKETL